MSATRSRTAEPLRGDQTAHSMGFWGLVLGLIVLVMFVAGLAAAALYLEAGQPRDVVTGETSAGWPPPGIDQPARLLAGIAVLATIGAAVSLTAALRRITADATQQATSLVGVGAATSIAAGVLLVVDLLQTPFSWDDHAYTSIYWALTGATILFVGVAALLAASVLVQLLTGVIDARRHLELYNSAVYAWFTVLVTTLLLALVHLLPLVAGSS